MIGSTYITKEGKQYVIAPIGTLTTIGKDLYNTKYITAMQLLEALNIYVDEVYINNKQIDTSELLELGETLLHIEHIAYHYSEDEKYGWDEIYCTVAILRKEVK